MINLGKLLLLFIAQFALQMVFSFPLLLTHIYLVHFIFRREVGWQFRMMVGLPLSVAFGLLYQSYWAIFATIVFILEVFRWLLIRRFGWNETRVTVIVDVSYLILMLIALQANLFVVIANTAYVVFIVLRFRNEYSRAAKK